MDFHEEAHGVVDRWSPQVGHLLAFFTEYLQAVDLHAVILEKGLNRLLVSGDRNIGNMKHVGGRDGSVFLVATRRASEPVNFGTRVILRQVA